LVVHGPSLQLKPSTPDGCFRGEAEIRGLRSLIIYAVNDQSCLRLKLGPRAWMIALLSRVRACLCMT
jgi:hypothetical protein